MNASYVTGAHNLKGGFQDSFAPYCETYNMNNDIRVAFLNSVPNVATCSTPPSIHNRISKRIWVSTRRIPGPSGVLA